MKYYYKDHRYEILMDARLKHPTNGQWVNCVIYYRIGDQTQLYVREAVDFYEKFKPVP